MKYLIYLLPLILCSCASHKCEPMVITKEVKIPVYQPLNIQEREIPKLPVQSLKPKSTPKEVAVAYDKTVIILLNEIKIYQNIIKKAKENKN